MLASFVLGCIVTRALDSTEQGRGQMVARVNQHERVLDRPSSEAAKVGTTLPANSKSSQRQSHVGASTPHTKIPVNPSTASGAILSVCHRRMKSREGLNSLLNDAGLVGEAVEIGVNEGDFAHYVLAGWHGKKYHMVDPWTTQSDEVYVDVNNRPQDDQDRKLRKVIKRLEPWKDKYVVHRQYSVEAAKTFANESMDFIYVDARHDYAGVKEDMLAWWPKLKRGGLFAGHDFVPDGIIKEGDFGVQKAVKELAEGWEREIQSISSKNLDTGRQEPQWFDGGWTTWYFFK